MTHPSGSRSPVLVAGASGGIGRAIAAALAKDGWDVALQYRSNPAGAREAAREVEAAGGRAVLVRGDLSRAEDCTNLVRAAREQLGEIAGLVHAAGICRRASASEQTIAQWDETIRVDLTSVFLLIQAVLPGMRSLGTGSIVAVASIAGITGGVMGPAYAASKGGVVSMTRYLGRELAAEGIRVNAVAPTLTDTRLISEVGVTQEDGSRLPLGRFVSPTEVAQVVTFLMSARASYVLGETIRVGAIAG